MYLGGGAEGSRGKSDAQSENEGAVAEARECGTGHLPLTSPELSKILDHVPHDHPDSQTRQTR